MKFYQPETAWNTVSAPSENITEKTDSVLQFIIRGVCVGDGSGQQDTTFKAVNKTQISWMSVCSA